MLKFAVELLFHSYEITQYFTPASFSIFSGNTESLMSELLHLSILEEAFHK